MADFKTQRKFRKAQESLFFPSVGADYIMVIKGYEELTLAVKTHNVGVLKNDEAVEYSTTHGVKTARDGFIQTYNDLALTFIDDEGGKVNALLDDIILGGKNNNLEVAFFKGRTEEALKKGFIGIIESGIITRGDPIEGDNENTTTEATIQAQLKGHWYPKSAGATPQDFFEAMGGLY
jgi:hypothetical protein